MKNILIDITKKRPYILVCIVFTSVITICTFLIHYYVLFGKQDTEGSATFFLFLYAYWMFFIANTMSFFEMLPLWVFRKSIMHDYGEENAYKLLWNGHVYLVIIQYAVVVAYWVLRVIYERI